MTTTTSAAGRGAWLGRLLRNRRAGESKLAWNQPGLDAPETIILTSPDFVDGSAMPMSSAGKGVGLNISPPLAWHGLAAQTAELVLIIEDPDVPLPRPVVHLALAGITPELEGFAEGDLNEGGPHGNGRGSFNRTGYAGPRPVPGHGPHHYVFQLYALLRRLDLPSGAKPSAVVSAMSGTVLARGRIEGTYER
jgi:Raf kinase inhibitor-like YbhB/YbcL family protein